MFRLQNALYKNTDEICQFAQIAADIHCNIQWFCSCHLSNCLYLISILVKHPDDGSKSDRFYQCAFVG